MSTYLESELQRIIAVTEQNEKIASEYRYRYFRIFLTAFEAKEILKLIERCKEHELRSPTTNEC